MPSNHHALCIAPAAQRTEAFELVLGDFAPSDRAEQIKAWSADAAAAEGLWEARRDGRLVGAILSQVQPGRTAIVWPPRVVSGESDHTAERLLQACDEQLAGRGVCMAHVLMESARPADDRVLRAGGYHPLADLLYLGCGEDVFPQSRPDGPLEFEPHSEVNRDRFARLVEATYDQTLDCPRLNHVRRTEDVLEGYRQTGVLDPGRWLIVRHQDEDVGCLIVTDHPDHGTCELIYMGLTVPARGHGWGKHIARYAQWLTGIAGRPRLVLAVDAANQPAIEMYAAVGFEAWERRVVYAKVFTSRV